MIIAVIGENTFQKQQQIATLSAQLGVGSVRYDGETMSHDAWRQLAVEQSLFSERQLVVIDELSKNSVVWDQLVNNPELNDNTIVLNETKVDKRTKTWKWLQKNAKTIDCSPMTDRDERQALSWLQQYATEQQVTLSSDLAEEMVRRAMRRSDVDERATIIDQELLATTVRQLRGADQISIDTVDAILAPSTHDNIFELFSMALEGKGEKVHQSIAKLSAHQDGYLAMGLLATQAQQLAGLVLAGGKSVDTVASDLGVHPYPLRQLSRFARSMSAGDISNIATQLARADLQVKSGKADPWMAIENALQLIAAIR